MSLQTDYRPKTFKTFMGNSGTIESLSNVLKRDKKPSAYLFTGPSGCGKTTLGRIVAKVLGCSDSDYQELTGASDMNIGPIRELLEGVKYGPLHGDVKVILIDEAHQLTGKSQEALLKALEEPPSYMFYIICTTNPEVFKTTFKRRCHNYELEPLRSSELYKLIKKVLKKEKVKKFHKDVQDKIVELSEGSAGIALKFLDMVIDMTDKKRALATLKAGGATEADVISICRCLCNGRMGSQQKWSQVAKLLGNFKGEPESARRAILGYLRVVLLKRKNFDQGLEIALMMEEFSRNYFDSGAAGLASSCFKACFTEDDSEETKTHA